MAYTYDAEDVAFEILNLLETNMAAKLDEIEAVKTASLTLEDIVKYYFGDKELAPAGQNLPAIIVKARSFVPTSTATDRRYRDNIKIEIECYIQENVNLTIEINNRTYDFDEILDIKIMRYARAIVEILTENEQLNGRGILQNFTEVLVSNVIPFETYMIKACRIEIDILGITNTL